MPLLANSGNISHGTYHLARPMGFHLEQGVTIIARTPIFPLKPVTSPRHPPSHAAKESRLAKRVGAIIREGTSDTRLILISANLKKVRERRTKWECLILAPYMPGPQTFICQSYQQNCSP